MKVIMKVSFILTAKK